MNHLSSTAMLIGATALVACAETPAAPSPAAPSPAAPSSAAPSPKQAAYEADSLERLRKLQIFTVTDVVAGQPEERYSCYGPCSKLGQLVEAAERYSHGPPIAGSCEDAAIKANLATIENVHAVHVGGLVPGDDTRKCERANQLANIAVFAGSIVDH